MNIKKVIEERRLANLSITAEAIVDLFVTHRILHFQITKGIPKGSIVVQKWIHPETQTVMLTLASEQFAPVSLDKEIPFVEVKVAPLEYIPLRRRWWRFWQRRAVMLPPSKERGA